VKYIHIVRPVTVLLAGAAPSVRGKATLVIQENDNRVGLWLFSGDNDFHILSDLDQSAPGFLVKGGALNVGLANAQFGDVPICPQGRLYACSISNVIVTLYVMELVREGGGLGASPP
jgi:hypothetical protein